MLQHKGLIKKVLWIYLFAFALVAFSFHSEANEATKEEKTTAEKPTEKSAEKSAEKNTEKSETKKDAKSTSKKDKKGKEMIAEFETNLGNFKIKLFKDKAPKTVDNFVGL